MSLSSDSRYPSPGMTGASSPATTGGPPTPAPGTQSTNKKPKPFNVFTNDGSFLERFQRSKKEEEERRSKEEDIINRKKDFESRFRNRGKRARPEAEDDGDDESTTSPISPVDGGSAALLNNPDRAPAKKAKGNDGIKQPSSKATKANTSKRS